MRVLQKMALVFTIIGAINWGLIGLVEFNLVTAIFGINSVLSRIIYVLVGLAGFINIGLLIAPLENKEIRK